MNPNDKLANVSYISKDQYHNFFEKDPQNPNQDRIPQYIVTEKYEGFEPKYHSNP